MFPPLTLCCKYSRTYDVCNNFRHEINLLDSTICLYL
nr:MAG TPA: hypothetical protein [Caudoviricetes sp.]